jgi:hypothetical protein
MPACGSVMVLTVCKSLWATAPLDGCHIHMRKPPNFHGPAVDFAEYYPWVSVMPKSTKTFMDRKQLENGN